MINLHNQSLTVELIDPTKDTYLLGTRYCTGCSIFQIHDTIKGPLLGGPRYPDLMYSLFDGQGAPEVFLTALNGNDTQIGDDVEVVGVGRILKTSDKEPFHTRNNPVVIEYAQWDTIINSCDVTMSTMRKFKSWAYSLMRKVQVCDRTVSSETLFENVGEKEIALKWFPHPFFPINQNGACCHFSDAIKMPENAGYHFDLNHVVCMKKEFDWDKGLYQPLAISSNKGLAVRQIHPLIDNVNVSVNYPVSFLPVWANKRTFSFEPYLERVVKPGESFGWKIEYFF